MAGLGNGSAAGGNWLWPILWERDPETPGERMKVSELRKKLKSENRF